MQYTYRKRRWMTTITLLDTSCSLSQLVGIISWIKALIQTSSSYKRHRNQSEALRPFSSPQVTANSAHICGHFPVRMMNFLYVYCHISQKVSETLNLRSLSKPFPPMLQLSSATLCLAPMRTTNAKTNRPTPATSPQELPLISAELYIFLIRSET